MSELIVSKSSLMNHGLGIGAFVPGLALGELEPDSPTIDPVLAFKDIVSTIPVADKDDGLTEAVAAAKSPIDLATFFINAKFKELGGSSGFLGTTIGAISQSKNSNGFAREFKEGLIVWHPDMGVHALFGPIRAKWLELGGIHGVLGFPISGVTQGTDMHQLGKFAHFQRGSIYWTPQPPVPPIVTTSGGSASGSTSLKADSTFNLASAKLRPEDINFGGVTGALIVAESSAGAFAVRGAIREKYLAMGAEASILGYPKTDETSTPDGIGRFIHFQAGSIYWTPGTGAHEVHGLIRNFWAANGSGSNPQLGYPITDELIPDPRIGKRRPEVRKKPILNIPVDVLKLPAEAVDAGFPATVVNASKTVAIVPMASSRTTVPAKSTLGLAANESPLGKLSDKTTSSAGAFGDVGRPVDPGFGLGALNTPASTPATARSVNRFADFESGVLFWQRGSPSAQALSPLNATADGTDLSFTGAEVTSLALNKIGTTNLTPAGAQLLSMTFIGTTGYSHDGAQVHNRRHRIQLILQRMETGPFGFNLPVFATVEVQIEVWFEATQRSVVFAPVDWQLLQSGTGAFASAITGALHTKLDSILWNRYELATLPDTDGGAPISVLSVKTMANGAVGVFVEPHGQLIFGANEIFTSAVAPTTIHFTKLNS